LFYTRTCAGESLEWCLRWRGAAVETAKSCLRRARWRKYTCSLSFTLSSIPSWQSKLCSAATYADNVALPAFARRYSNRSISPAPAGLLLWAHAVWDRQTDRQTDGLTPYRYMLVDHTMRAVPIMSAELFTAAVAYSFVIWPTTSCFADWSKRRHVTLSIIICSPLHGRPGWHYNVTPGDVTWRSLNANVRYILCYFCLRLFFLFFFLASYCAFFY